MRRTIQSWASLVNLGAILFQSILRCKNIGAKQLIIIDGAFDRAARSVRHFLEVLDELNHLGIEFASLRENIDTAGPRSGRHRRRDCRAREKPYRRERERGNAKSKVGRSPYRSCPSRR